MNLKQLEALIAVNQHGTFKQAAESLYFESPGEEYITPESIQYRLRQLEEELGVSLYRKRQGSPRVTLTREGKLFLREAIEVHERMMEWRGLFLEEPRGTLTFASTQAVIINRMFDAIVAYKGRFPNVAVHTVSANAPRMESLVASGKVDFAISTRPPAEAELDYVRWKESEMVVVTPRGHPLTKVAKPRLADVVRYPLLLLESELRSDRQLVDDAFDRAGIHRPHVAMQASDSATLLTYVEGKLGVAIISETNLLRTRRNVVSVRLGSQIGRSEVGLLLRDGQYLPSRVREFLLLLDPEFEPILKERDERIERQREERREHSKRRRRNGSQPAPAAP